MRIEVIHKHGQDVEQVRLAEICAGLARALEDHPEIRSAGAHGHSIRLVLGGEEECRAWGVAPDALGFHAVISDHKADEDGPIPEDGGDPPGYFEICEAFEAHVNIEAGCKLLQSDGVAEEDRAGALFAFLITVPHEILHVRDWILETGGKTPLQVFDEGQGELSLRSTLEAIESRHSDNGAECEDAIEQMAYSITEAHFAGRLESLAANYPWATTLGPAGSSF